MGINISNIANQAVNAITDNTWAIYYKFTGIDNTGLVCVNTYAPPITVFVMVQNANDQELRNMSGYQETRIYKDVWLDMKASGLNWSEQRQQDKLVIDGIVYYIIKQVHDFNNQQNNNGWCHVVCAQSTDEDEG